MRIGVVTTSYPLRDGQAAGHFVAAEVQHLCAAHDVVVIAPGVHTEAIAGAPRVLRIAGHGLFGPPGALIRVRRRPWRAWGAAAFCWQARRLLQQHGPFDRIIAHWLVPCAWPILPAAGAALEAVAHGSDVGLLAALPQRLRRHIASTWLERDVQLRCVSSQLRDALIACTTPELGPRIRVEPMQLELSAALGRAAARHGLGIDPRTRLVLLVARLIPEKRVSSALRAVVRLPDVAIVVVGGGPLLDGLRRSFPCVRFTGDLPRPEALQWIAAADVLLSASRHEGAPTALREARALGVPVVACAAGDLVERATRDAGVWLV